ncbi:MAG: hypothetical protein LUC31_03480 [Coprobacillus sp.]|nr:hypothetical protein [Coprobacillus sp.]
MPYCRNCHTRISRYDKDICPVCGVERPLDGVTSETVDITSQINIGDEQYKNYKPKTRGKAFMFSATLGIFGAPMYYLGHLWAGLVHGFICLAIILGAGITLGLLYSWIWPVIIVVFMYLVNILFGLYYLYKSDLTDKNGEFLH